MKRNCHPGQAVRMHRAEPEPIAQQSRWVPDNALARVSGMTININGC
jgi:hypothetical protein